MCLSSHVDIFIIELPCIYGCLLDHGIVIGRGQSWDTSKGLSFLFTVPCGCAGHSSEGQVIVLQNGEAILPLVLLQVEYFPQLLQLLQLTEGLQHHQHDDKTQDQVNCQERHMSNELW